MKNTARGGSLKGFGDKLAWLGLYNAVAYAAAFTLLGRVLESLSPLPLLTLLMILVLPLTFVWAAITGRTLRFRINSRQMIGPLFLSLLIFPGFLHLLTVAYGYTHTSKLLLIFAVVSLGLESWRRGKLVRLLPSLAATLLAILILSFLLSEGLSLWPLLWAESAMAMAALSLSLFPVLTKKWSQRVSLPYEQTCFWSLVWTLPWLLAAMWISGRGLPVPPLDNLNWKMLIIWVFLFFSAMIVVEGGRIQSRESGDYALIFILFLPLFSLIFSFLEFDYRPDWYDLMALIGLMAGSVFLHAGNQNKTKADESGRPDEQGVANGS
jgi:hypothetical protein